MAAIESRVRGSGEQSHRVKWRENGTWQGETFRDLKAAKKFKADVEYAGGWPPGWVKGVGPAQVAQAEDPEAVSFTEMAARYLKKKKKVQGDTVVKYAAYTRNDFGPIFPAMDSITEESIGDWIEHELEKGNSPKTIANKHGFLFAVCAYAVEKEVLRANPCERTELPDQDDYDEGEDKATFLETEEFALLLRCAVESSRDFLRALTGTGLRFSELTAVQKRDLSLDGEVPTLAVRRAWKDAGRKLGAPKTKRSRRTITLDEDTADMFRRLVAGKGAKEWVFATRDGDPLSHSLVYDNWWLPAVARARKAGLEKTPRLHDLRHTHASWLIAGNVPLTVIAERLGHQSIKTTSDRYGHLVKASQTQVWAAIAAMMPRADDGAPMASGLAA